MTPRLPDVSGRPSETKRYRADYDEASYSRRPRLRTSARRRPDTAVASRRHNEGHGRRLTAAFEALEAFPALAESRNRSCACSAQEQPSTADVVAAVESDVALAIAVLRLANQVEGKTRGKVDSVVKAVEVLSPEAVQALASRARTFDFFERSGVWDVAPERFRLHARRHPARRRPPRQRDSATSTATA